jgi:hypothetical protein
MTEERAPAKRAAAGLAAAVLLAALAWMSFGHIFDSRPTEGDNLYILSWLDHAPATSLLRVDPVIYPEWRPVAYQALWLQYRWQGIDHVWLYYLVNLGLWTLAAWILYLVVVRLAHSRLAALVAAAFFLTDLRATWTLTWIVGRQNVLACLFGLVAVWIVVRAGERRLSRAEQAGLLVCLLASALGKEYGLAVAAALAVYGFSERRRDLAAMAVTALGAYVAIRVVFAGGAVLPRCGPAGGGCEATADAPSLPGAVYHVVTTAIGIVYPGLFDNNGDVGIARFRIIESALWLAVAVAGFRRGPKPARLAALVIAASALVSFWTYLSRDHLVGLIGFRMLIGLGLPVAYAALTRRLPARLVQAGGAVVLLVLLAAQVHRTRLAVAGEVDPTFTADPCIGLMHPELYDPAMIRRIKHQYGLSNPDCSSRPQAGRPDPSDILDRVWPA